jgi:hypothetical protein
MVVLSSLDATSWTIQTITGAGFLSVDNKLIYQMNDFTVRIAAG